VGGEDEKGREGKGKTMLSVFGLTANGRTDPTATVSPVTLSWRLGAEGAGYDQASYRVRVTSLDTGELVLDTGEVASASNRACFACDETAGTYVWFVEVRDTGGDLSCSAPAAFRLADRELGAARPPCMAVLATAGSTRLYHDQTLSFLADDTWASLIGLALVGDLVRCQVPPEGPSRVRASLLAPRGLVVATLRRTAYACRLTLSLAPGMRAEVTARGRTVELASGIHTIDV
jgi:hypothetical protein